MTTLDRSKPRPRVLTLVARSLERVVARLLKALGWRTIHIAHPDSIGHLCLEPASYWMDRVLEHGRIPRTFILRREAEDFANHTLAGYLERYYHVVRSPTLARFLTACFTRADAVVHTQHYVSAMYTTARCFEVITRWGDRPPMLSLTDADARHGDAVLRQMGLPDGAWFVCVHARGAGYSPVDESNNYHRNVDIDDYALAIDAIVARGGWCIRVGDPTMKPLTPRPQVIDYAHSPYRSDRMDVILPARCRFFLGCASGLYAVSTLFGPPLVMVDVTPMSGVYAPGIRDLAIPQRVRTADGRVLGLEEVMASDVANFRLGDEFAARGLVPTNVPPEEVRDVVVEMLDRLDGTAVYSEDDEARQAEFRALFREGHYGYKAGGRVGRDFLRAHFGRSAQISSKLPS